MQHTYYSAHTYICIHTYAYILAHTRLYMYLQFNIHSHLHATHACALVKCGLNFCCQFLFHDTSCEHVLMHHIYTYTYTYIYIYWPALASTTSRTCTQTCTHSITSVNNPRQHTHACNAHTNETRGCGHAVHVHALAEAHAHNYLLSIRQHTSAHVSIRSECMHSRKRTHILT
jgi:hypothetical protein